MQFVWILLLGFAFIFLGTFFVTGITDSLKNLSTGAAFQSGYYQQYAQQPMLQGNTSTQPLFNEPLKGRDIETILADINGAARFKTLFREAQGASYLNDTGTLYTLFVPLDSAFTKLPYEAQSELNTMTAEEKTRFVTNHLVPQKMVAVGGQKFGYVTTVSRDTLNFSLHEESGIVGNARVVAVYPAENGIIYVIDGVLVPPEMKPIFTY